MQQYPCVHVQLLLLVLLLFDVMITGTASINSKTATVTINIASHRQHGSAFHQLVACPPIAKVSLLSLPAFLCVFCFSCCCSFFLRPPSFLLIFLSLHLLLPFLIPLGVSVHTSPLLLIQKNNSLSLIHLIASCFSAFTDAPG